jgi:hypothetical protein
MSAPVVAAVIAGVVALGTGIVTLLGVRATIRQKDATDRRSEWWRRASWALERTAAEDDATAALGWQVLTALLNDRELATASESAIVEVLAELEAFGDTGLQEVASNGNDRA